MKSNFYPSMPVCCRWVAALLLLIAGGPDAWAQTPDWQRALAITTTASSTSLVSATALDGLGNVYVAGSFSGTVSFGSTTLSGPANYCFVAKWNPTLNSWAWAKSIPTTQAVYINTLAAQDNAVYLGGTFLNSVSFGSTTLSGAVSYRGFVAKLVDAGSSASFGWAEAIGGAFYDYVLGLAVQGSSVYVVGAVHSPVVTFGTATVANPGYSTGYVAKLLDTGPSASYAWVQPVSSPTLSRLDKVVVQGPSVYVTGYFGGSATCGTTTIATSNANDVDVLVAKLTDAGSSAGFNWAQQAGGTGADRPTALAVVGANVYVAGNTDSPSAVFGTSSQSGLGKSDIFVAKLTDAGATGHFAWAQLAGGTSFDGAIALAVRGSSVYVGGFVTSAQAYFGTTVLTGLGDYDAFVARLIDGGSSSRFAWARQAGSSGSDEATSLVLLGSQVVVGGYVEHSSQFGPQVISSSATDTFGFLATIDDAAALAIVPGAPAREVCIYPNPAHKWATVAIATRPEGSTATLALFDALGRRVRTASVLPVIGRPASLDLTGLAPGIYAVQVQAGGHTTTRRLVVE